MATNSFGLPQSKKDVVNRNTHLRTGTPSFQAVQEPVQAATPIQSEAQNAQAEAMQAIERQQQSGGTMNGY